MSSVREQTIGAYLDALGSTSAVPGGGSAAALAAAMGAALVSMVAKLSARKAQEEADRTVLGEVFPQLDRLAARLLDLSQQDIDAYRAVIDTRKSNPEAAAMARAYERAAEVPMEVAEIVNEVRALAADVGKRAWEMTASDLAVGNDLLEAGFGGALGNVAINLPELRGDTAKRIEARYLRLRT